MNTQAIAEKYADHPFVDYFDCLDASLAAAKNRNKLAVRARLAGRHDEASRHTQYRDEYMSAVREFHRLIDWSDE